jgi:arylsulfatase A-like enzyme
MVELAGARPDEDHPFDGTSLVPYLMDGQKLQERPLFWRLQDWRALRQGKLKYVRMDDASDHLYDLGADVHEQADLGDLRPEDLERLRDTWEQIAEGQLPYD